MPDFARDLTRGQSGEAWFVDHYPGGGALAEQSTRAFDVVLPDARTLELKTDSYSHVSTPNCFMERWTKSGSRRSDGGPWRAARDGVDVFAYLFMEPEPLLYVWHDVDRLVSSLDDWIRHTRRYVHRVQNAAWCGEGYLVPRTVLALPSRVTYAWLDGRLQRTHAEGA